MLLNKNDEKIASRDASRGIQMQGACAGSRFSCLDNKITDISTPYCTNRSALATQDQETIPTNMSSQVRKPPPNELLPALRQPHFKIEAQHGGPLRRKFVAAIARPLGRIMGLPLLNEIYDRVATRQDHEDFLDKTLEVMGVDYRVTDEDLSRIPPQGPVIIVANHPFGAIEGVLLMALLGKIRPDFKVMGTHFLRFIPEIRDKIIFVDNFGKNSSMRSNIAPMKESLRCLRDGHLLAIFPAGEVSHMTFRKRRVTDPVWSPTVARIVRKTQAAVVPIFFQGHNGPLFQLLGLVHPRLRTVMLPRELANKRSHTIDISIGSAIPYKKLAAMSHDKDLVNYLRLRTYVLRQRYAEKQKRSLLPMIPLSLPNKKPVSSSALAVPPKPVAPPVEACLLQKELSRLPDDNLLFKQGDYSVYAASGNNLHHVMDEIGRLREYTFRLVGEGTGKETDIDRFDQHYDHLFIWNSAQQEIVGAYRIGKTDEIIENFGIEGLYTSTLFTFKPALFEHMGKALEMGRSFVRPEYQRSYNALFLLWKGIGGYVLRNPDHVVLFGPVSISNEYSTISRELIVRYLKSKDSFSKLHKLVKPKTPPRFKGLKRHELREFKYFFKSVDEVTEIITDLETEFKGIPVLLRQYLKLGGKVLSFNVDPDFQDCLDGLIKVDVLHTPPRILGMYMGKENVELLLEYHEAKKKPHSV